MAKQVLIKLESAFLRDIDKVVKEKHYQSRAEFIREVLRKKMSESALEKEMLFIRKTMGRAKRKVSDEEYESVRRNVHI